MLSYKNENGNVKELAGQGSMGDLIEESAYLLTAVYSMLARRDKAEAVYRGRGASFHEAERRYDGDCLVTGF